MIHVTVTATNRMPPLFAPEPEVKLRVGKVAELKKIWEPSNGVLLNTGEEVASHSETGAVEVAKELEKVVTLKPKPNVTFEDNKQDNSKDKSVKIEMLPNSMLYKNSKQGIDWKVLNAIQLIEEDNFPYVDIYGYNNEKVYLERCILGLHGLRRCMRMFKNYSNTRNILLYGKDMGIMKKVAICVAKQINISFMAVTGSKLYSKYGAESSKMVHEVFLRAAAIQPCILYFDNADLQCGDGKDANTRDVKVQFCVQLDSSRVFNSSVFVIVGTNKPWKINHKLLSRFEEKIFIDCFNRPYGRQMKGFRANNDPKYNPEQENYYSLLDVFSCFKK